MKKLMLNVEALEVETFQTEPSERSSGTVAAHELSQLCQPTGSPACPASYDPRDVYCALQSPDGGGGYCTPVCYTYHCTNDPDLC